jgi:hypothetical protein
MRRDEAMREAKHRARMNVTEAENQWVRITNGTHLESCSLEYVNPLREAGKATWKTI